MLTDFAYKLAKRTQTTRLWFLKFPNATLETDLSGLKIFDRALQYLRIKPRQNELDKENKTIE
jgi:hypothetical protein